MGRVAKPLSMTPDGRTASTSRSFCSFDQSIYGHLTRRNLAALSTERGDHAEARRLWADVLAECPGDREAVAKLERLRSMVIGP
jgi:hypothetical protein